MYEHAQHIDYVDPRVQIELERLNTATDEINKGEVELEEARLAFKNLLLDSSAKINALRLKLGLCIEQAKPYYEARFRVNNALEESQIAAVKFEKASSTHSAAREMVYLAEQGLGGKVLDSAWQEMLNHATQKVNEAEHEKIIAESEHKRACSKYQLANVKVQYLQKELKRSITKSSIAVRRSLMKLSSLLSQHDLMFLPFYELKAHYNQLLDQRKNAVQNLENQISTSKLTYSGALKNLEKISEEIHETRKNSMEYINKQSGLGLKAQIAVRDEICVPCGVSKEESPVSTDFTTISNSSEWTEINLDVSSPEEESVQESLNKLGNLALNNCEEKESNSGRFKSSPGLLKSYDFKPKGRRQSLDTLLGPTGEKVKEIFSQGIMMFNMGLNERRNSEPRVTGLEKNDLESEENYVTNEDSSESYSFSSSDMLNEDQISFLMLDKEIENVSKRIFGVPESSS